METKKIYRVLRNAQHTHFVAARFFANGKRDKAMVEFNNEIKQLVGNVVYDDDKKKVGDYLRQMTRVFNDSTKSTFSIFVEPLKTITDNNGMKCDCYECTAANDKRTKQVCMVFLLPVGRQLYFE